jgi:MFS family permease
MLGFSTYAALLPELRDEWRLSNSEAGIVSGMFFAGYIGTVSLWTALTDRIDGRKVYLAGSVCAAAGSAGFGFMAAGFASALVFQVLLGVGIAATYMPGLRLLSDRISGPSQSRYVAFYTSFFGIGTALSLAMAGLLAPVHGWRFAFTLSALGPIASGLLVVALLRPVRRILPAGFRCRRCFRSAPGNGCWPSARAPVSPSATRRTVWSFSVRARGWSRFLRFPRISTRPRVFHGPRRRLRRS